MLGFARPFPFQRSIAFATGLLSLFGCSARPAPKAHSPVAAIRTKSPMTVPASKTPARLPADFPVMLGIDVLEADGFRAVAGKTIGLLTHPPGVNRRGESTVQVLRRASNTRLVALFAPEHGLYGDVKAGENIDDSVDRRTGLPVHSLHGANRKPTAEQLKGLDALVIDLQDIGVRSYTFNVVMRYAMEACFTQGVEVILLDRPNPLGGLKVDGPPLDREWMSGVGAFRIPYVHGLTMGELASMAAYAPGVMEVPEAVRAKGKLTIVPMRGWRRTMRWPETGLRFAPTSPLVQDFAAVVGYAMVGLGCEFSGFKHGVGVNYPFRGLSYKGKTADELQRDLNALQLPGIKFTKIASTNQEGRNVNGVYVEVTDWEAWNPTELSFHLMRLACVYSGSNPFARLDAKDTRSFNIHVGSTAWWTALVRDGPQVDVEGWVARWKAGDALYQRQSQRYWLYR